jgi:ribosomal protein L35AE/L33A
MALLKIAKDFVEYVEVPFEVKDLVLTGSQLGYYYTKHSDLDLHIIVDFDTVNCDREAAELFDTKRLLYKKQYDISIHGVPVEVYIEDSNFPAVSATYSLGKGGWKVKPNSQPEEIDSAEIIRMSKIWGTVIGKAIESNDLETGRKVLKMLRNYRKLGLKQTGEYGIENLVYKTLRNSKIIEKLMKMIGDLHDQSLSIK